MKKKDLPQDKSALKDFTREVCYVKNKEGNYETELSTGWETKKVALDKAWDEIERRKSDALQKIEIGKASPLLYFMEEKLMDPAILAGYARFWKWQVKRHLKAKPFAKLAAKKLQKYADALNISVEDLKNFNEQNEL